MLEAASKLRTFNANTKAPAALDECLALDVNELQSATEKEMKDTDDKQNAYKVAYENELKKTQLTINYIKVLQRESNVLKSQFGTLVDTLQSKVGETLDHSVRLMSSKQDQMLEEVKRNIRSETKQLQYVRQCPPPCLPRTHDSATGLISFLNEELEEYYTDIGIWSKLDKCRHLNKIFTNFSEHKQTTKRFFNESKIQTLVKNEGTSMVAIYAHLTNYIYREMPEDRTCL